MLTPIFMVMIGVVLYSGSSRVAAQMAVEEAGEFDLQSAPIRVGALKLEKKEYSPGDLVKGTVEFFNPSDRHTSDVHYLIRLQGDYQPNGLAKLTYDTVPGGPVFVGAHQIQKTSFEYRLPPTVSGELGIHIDAMLQTGVPMGWSDAFIRVSGTPRMLTVGKASLQIEGKSFEPESGPTMTKGQKISAVIELKNSTDSAITATPTVRVYTRSIVSEPLGVFPSPPVTVGTGQTQSARIDLPTLDDRPGIYAGSISFLDRENALVARAVTVRYIIDGDIGIIDRISTVQQSIRQGERITVVANLSSSPLSFGSGDRFGVRVLGKTALRVQVLNEEDALVAEAVKELDLSVPVMSTTMTLTATRDARQLKIRSTLEKGSVVLSSYQTDLEPDPKVPAPTEPVKARPVPWSMILAAVVGILVLGMIIRSFRHE